MKLIYIGKALLLVVALAMLASPIAAQPLPPTPASPIGSGLGIMAGLAMIYGLTKKIRNRD